jgi:hypothetical protein
LQTAAHKLKGTLMHLEARTACEPALRLEVMGRERNLGGAAEPYTTLEAELGRLQKVLAGLIQTEKPPSSPARL